ncbi:MAG: DNA polymerase II large subunit [Candidatus Diapherotrites archaeon]
MPAIEALVKGKTLNGAGKNSLNFTIVAEERIKKYYDAIAAKTFEQFELAKKARAKGKDVSMDVETTPTMDLADRCENITGPKGIAKRYREVIEEMKGNRIKTIFRLFEEIIAEKGFDLPDREKRLEQAMRTSLVLVTEGVVVAPLDGVPQVKISKNFDGSEYVDIFYAGPIRAAGGTATVFPLILGDYARKLMALDRYKPTDDEIERYVEETQIYDEIVTRQYKSSPDEVRKIIRGCPVCINGEPTEEREITVHKDLERVPTNRVRGGMCLVISEGVGQKAAKILTYAKMLGLDWRWLEEIIKVSKGGGKEESIGPSTKYLGRIAAGRPIFCYPSRPGGFRLRYGRARTTCAMAKAVHPATMQLLDEFIAVGTQLKVERPGKSAEMFACDSIEGPIVKLLDGEVRKIESMREALEVKNSLKEILFLGDYLVTVGDFRKSAHPLMPVGYCEEWWALELKKALSEGKEAEGVNTTKVLKEPRSVDCFTAVEISMQSGVPMHPKFTHYYSLLEKEEAVALISAARSAGKSFEENLIVEARLENSEKIKEMLEKIGLPHKVDGSELVIGRDYAYPFLKTFGAFSSAEVPEEKSVLEMLSDVSGLVIRDKAGTFVGTRMGRPEASRPRKMVGNPHMLFPIGIYGGNTRSINKAMNSAEKNRVGSIEVEIASYYCKKCGKINATVSCTECGGRAEKLGSCTKCGAMSETEKCARCGAQVSFYGKRAVDINALMTSALHELKVKQPEIVKGVKGLMNKDKEPEPLEKGILRAVHDLHIFRDATIRYELLNAVLTHFKPEELGTSVEKLKEMGYEKDVNGRPLENEGQMLELFPQDIVIHENAGDFLVSVTKFIDDLLEKFYSLPRYYNRNSRNELVGELVLGLAPHTSAAIVGRIIGYTKARLNFAHPFFHLCKRRNIDGDQDSIMLLMDGLLNFSHHYLPSSRGGRMDAPLVFTIALNPAEIDDEAHEIETCSEYPLELYEKAQQFLPADISSIPRVGQRLGKIGQYTGIGYTHETRVFDEGPKMSKYVQLATMEEKIKSQAKIQSKIKALDKKDALERVLVSHFLPDIIGNARSFSRQTFRCTNCNSKYRRIPLTGKCTRCKDDGNIVLTIAQGSVRKYLLLAKEIVNSYGLSNYLKQRLDLIQQEVDSIFVNEKTDQKSLFEFV